MIQMGATTEALALILTAGADFVCTLVNTDGDWADGDTIELRFSNDTTWEADIVGAEARWNVDKVDVQAVLDDRHLDVVLAYVNGPVDLVWARGRV